VSETAWSHFDNIAGSLGADVRITDRLVKLENADMRGRLITIGFTALLVPLTFINAPWPQDVVLQHIPTVVLLPSLWMLTIRYPISFMSFFCMITFLWMHILGSHWTYSSVPYDDWFEAIFRFRLADYFGWKRNHYDRLVHLGSGIFGVPPAYEALRRSAAMPHVGAVVMAISAVMAIGALYEIAEWQLAMILSPEQAATYNGQQGDLWDAQKDLAMALGGSIISALLVFWLWPQEKRNEKQ